MAPPAPTTRPAAGGRRLPRWLLALGAPLVAVALVGLFVFLRFPFDRFGDALAAQAGAAIGAEVVLGSLDPTLGLRGPGFLARDVRVRFPDGADATLERVVLRPAWSPAWLRGRPAVRLEADSELGRLDGALTLGREPRFAGRLTALALGRLPLARLAGGVSLDGELDLDGDLGLRAGTPVGEASFHARTGSLSAPNLPIAVPYETLVGTVRFGEDGSMALEDVRLDGPMLVAEVSGGTGPGPSPWLAPLALDVHLEVRDRNLRPALASSGLRLRPDGSADLKLRGNLAAPVIR